MLQKGLKPSSQEYDFKPLMLVVLSSFLSCRYSKTSISHHQGRQDRRCHRRLHLHVLHLAGCRPVRN